ncbi:MAG: hypothetical protein BWK74_04990 [Desulfobacteraceae bacterium A6]|nr:MAG: hypothetical protein BWK74_04990 [Desulfobacteraceae bacterium A6]
MIFRALNKTKRDLNLALLTIFLSVCIYFLAFCSMAIAGDTSGEPFYKYLSSLAGSGNNSLIEELNTTPRKLDWNNAAALKFKGHLRFLTSVKPGSTDQTRLYFIRNTEGSIIILTIPDSNDPVYQNLEKLIESKLNFDVKVLNSTIGDKEYQFAQFINPPVQAAFDKIFKLMIILMLFLVMVGMGLTLTGKDFSILISKPRGIIIGEILQFGVMPLIAVALGYLIGLSRKIPLYLCGNDSDNCHTGRCYLKFNDPLCKGGCSSFGCFDIFINGSFHIFCTFAFKSLLLKYP